MRTRHIIHKGKTKIQELVPAKVIQSRIYKRVFQQFATKLGLVYFGYVDQRDDEHSLVRGVTVSTKHRDNHYCIGSYDGYDLTVVERVDTLHFPGKESKMHNWTIMTLDLHRSHDVPHVYMGLTTHHDTFHAHLLTKLSHFAKIHVGVLGHYEPAFTNKYALYAKAEQALTVERLFNPAVAKAIADSFGQLTLEIDDGTLYIYAESQRPTAALLDKMLQCGVWLAQVVDSFDDNTLDQ
jgi:hypothetical protein